MSVVTVHRLDPRFVRHCASTPGYAATQRYYAKLDEQYAGRLSHAHLIPLIAESGGRWHPEAHKLLRQLARAYVHRTPGLDESALGAVVARWASRLSAALLRGNAAAQHAAGWTHTPAPRDAVPAAGPLCHVLPEGECVYELLVGHVHTLDDGPDSSLARVSRAPAPPPPGG